MKILYYFPERSVVMHQWQRLNFREELSHYNVSFETFNPLMFESFEEANERLLREINAHHYDLFFTNVCTPKILFPETLLDIKKNGIPTLSFRGDNLIWALNDKALAPLFDVVWLTSVEIKYLYDKWRVNTIFAPYAANPYIYVYSTKNYICRKCCFIGTPYGSRSIMLNRLTKNSIPIDVFYKENTVENKQCQESTLLSIPPLGSKWNTYKTKEGWHIIFGAIVNKLIGENSIIHNNFLGEYPQIQTQNQSSLYSKYAISLSSTSARNTDVLRRNLPIINLRSFEIPMSGGLQLCRFNEELSSYFEEDKEILFYRNDEELVDKAKYIIYQASEKEILKMKEAARKRAECDHTWIQRFKYVFETLGLKI